MIVCICKGINLGKVIKGMEGCETVLDVNRKVGTGTGGCKGERCGPRIKILLNKKREAAEKMGVNDRWVRTLLERMDKRGDAVVVHGLRGRPSNRKLQSSVQRMGLPMLTARGLG